VARYICDLECDNLLDNVTVIHCAVLKDIDTGVSRGFQAHELDEFFEIYKQAELIIGHSFIAYDYQVIKKLYGITIPEDRIIDTLILGRLVHSDIKQSDFDRARLWKEYVRATEDGGNWSGSIPREFPGHMIGRHSLEAWGFRMSMHKGDYSKDMKAKGLDPWAAWNPEMHEYMMQDGEVTFELYQKLMAHDPDPRSVRLEMRIAWLCAQIERNGFPFDVPAASKLYGELSDEREALRRDLIGLFPNWQVRLPDFIPARNNKTQGYIKGVPVERYKDFEFNPGSRAHITNRLIFKYQWKPTVFTQELFTDPETGEKVQPGSPQIDDDILASLPYPEAKRLSRFFLLDKRISQLATGKQAWLKVQREGKIHAIYTTNGANTGRATHSKPNISGVPRVSSEFGRECRALFYAPAGWKQLGADQSGLELRCLASDMSPFDEGIYATVVTTGDVHTINKDAAGLSTRDQAKTFIYAFLYGAGDEKIGTICGVTEEEAKGWQGNPTTYAAVVDARSRFIERYKKAPTKQQLRLIFKGETLKASFLAKTPALNKLITSIKKEAKAKFIRGLDGRKMNIRSPHASLNTRLQNAGAVICKQWGVDWDDALKAQGLKHGWDGDYVFMSWSHDEYQLAVRDRSDLLDLVARLGVETGRNAGLDYNFNCPLDVEFKIGGNWSECH
jgi:DNA polymerase-1